MERCDEQQPRMVKNHLYTDSTITIIYGDIVIVGQYLCNSAQPRKSPTITAGGPDPDMLDNIQNFSLRSGGSKSNSGPSQIGESVENASFINCTVDITGCNYYEFYGMSLVVKGCGRVYGPGSQWRLSRARVGRSICTVRCGRGHSRWRTTQIPQNGRDSRHGKQDLGQRFEAAV